MNPIFFSAEASTSRKRRAVVEREREEGPSALPQLSLPRPSLQKYIDDPTMTDLSLSLAISPLPKSFVALLTQDDDEDEHAKLLQHQMAEIDSFIQTQNENIRRGLQDLWNETVEKMNKKVREKEVEASVLKQIAECHKNNAQQWQARAMGVEQALASMRTAMHETLKSMANWKKPSQQEEDKADSESSSVDPGPMESPINCKLCDKRPATLMMIPCRHVAVCLRCEVRAKDCPLCGYAKGYFCFANLPNLNGEQI